MFRRYLAMDLGTANTIIMQDGEIILEQPSIVAIDRRTEQIIAVGERAMRMHEKTHENIKTIRPLRDGVIADFTAAQAMIHEFLRAVPRKGLARIFPVSWHVVISIPSSVTEVEKRAVRESAEQAGASQVYLIYQPMAAAIGLGLKINEPIGYMIVDIGGGTTDITVISNQGIVVDQSIRIAGDEMTQGIIDYVRKRFQVHIGERTAEEIKQRVGAAIPDLANPPEPIAIVGRDAQSGLPKEIQITHEDACEALEDTLRQIEETILKALGRTPPSLASDIYEQGIWLTGGGSLIHGLDVRLSRRTHLKVQRAEHPLLTVAIGASRVVANLDEFEFALI